MKHASFRLYFSYIASLIWDIKPVIDLAPDLKHYCVLEARHLHRIKIWHLSEAVLLSIVFS